MSIIPRCVSERLADPERAGGLENSGSSHCAGDPPNPLHKRLSFFRTFKISITFSF